ncbi:hypothetical protein PIB30_103291 [Stylosanthes scabra]|uniref:Uncharacterized protein n=1 Tax=Stylosanthes scabra TaxID=79078 RepID=A0ABU6V0N2_9FABA|nr:hypothetical protein [Stylosanthes scabra]
MIRYTCRDQGFANPSISKVVVVADGNSGAAAALLLLHCLLPLEAFVHLHHHPLAVVVADFLIVLGKLKFPLPRNLCAITTMLSTMISSARTSLMRQILSRKEFATIRQVHRIK